MFDTHETLHQALAASGTWNALYTALMASTPPLVVRAHEPNHDGQVTGLRFFEHLPSHRQNSMSGRITISPDDGTITVFADGYAGPRWFAALERLGVITAPTNTTSPASAALCGWSWQPADCEKPGALAGTVRLGPHIQAETFIDRSGGGPRTNTDAGLALIPADRETCGTAWALAVTVLGVLVTGDSAYLSTVMPAPDLVTLIAPATDYRAAAGTVTDLLELLDDNPDFGHARDHDPYWPARAERVAIRALRALRDALDDVHRTITPAPQPDTHDRGSCCDCPHEMEE
ncbi:hypothetical protein ACFVYG_20200 [Streptomyces sp. NPDC058256]|uniref:hypothetical protein n=1 Tax=Streptomyces sp. NPDC058256 TaxID=3346408 RepID=UPI0036EBEA90